MKTITQIAKEIGVSRQAVYDKIKKEPLSSTLQPFTLHVDNTLHYTIEGEKLIKIAFKIKEPVSSVSINEIDDPVKILIKTLQEQVSSLNKQNEDLRQQLNEERVHTREQSDKIISLAEQLAELNKNNQILLKQEQERNIALLPEKLEENNTEEAVEKKRGLFKKMFGKNK